MQGIEVRKWEEDHFTNSKRADVNKIYDLACLLD